MIGFYAFALDVVDGLLSLSSDPSSTIATSPTARSMFQHLFLVNGLNDYNDRANVADFFWESRPRFLASGETLSEVPSQPYDPSPSRASFSGFMAGYTIMKTLSSMLDVTSNSFVHQLYDSGDLFLNRTYLGPFHDFCKTPNETLCFCNTAFHDNDVLTLDTTSGRFTTDKEYEEKIRQHDPPLEGGKCVDETTVQLRYPIGLYVLPVLGSAALGVPSLCKACFSKRSRFKRRRRWHPGFSPRCYSTLPYGCDFLKKRKCSNFLRTVTTR